MAITTLRPHIPSEFYRHIKTNRIRQGGTLTCLPLSKNFSVPLHQLCATLSEPLPPHCLCESLGRPSQKSPAREVPL